MGAAALAEHGYTVARSFGGFDDAGTATQLVPAAGVLDTHLTLEPGPVPHR